ncbi:MAG: hypothetical protein MZV64_31200 [Ignavibacteriales bacterium]|nr:hypothetical protein [Ignavibacteriales bacterium]
MQFIRDTDFLQRMPTSPKSRAESDIKFIGPSPDMINAMGDKSFAKDTMRKNGVPVIPGSDGVLKNPAEGKELAQVALVIL